jgi:hypothetical protein
MTSESDRIDPLTRFLAAAVAASPDAATRRWLAGLLEAGELATGQAGSDHPADQHNPSTKT